jgi:hypothetical protein
MFKDTIASGMECLEKENIEVYIATFNMFIVATLKKNY